MEQAALARVWAISDPADTGDPGYVHGLRASVGTALSYGLTAVESTSEDPPPVPDALLHQARAAARNRIPLDVVLRRYLSGYFLLEQFLVETIAQGQAQSLRAELKRVLRREAALFDNLVDTVSKEYLRERRALSHDTEGRRGRIVQMLLAGDAVDAEDLNYELNAFHTGLVASGPGARRPIRALARSLGCELLIIRGTSDQIWAWFGGRRELPSTEILRLAEEYWPATAALSVGEPASGMAGWRQTHRQANAAAPVAALGATPMVRYVDVALLSTALSNELLARSLHETYLVPLEKERGGSTLHQTLIAYFETGRNAASAAAALGVSRKTVSVRLQRVEEALGRPLEVCAAELETALHLWRLDHGGNRRPHGVSG